MEELFGDKLKILSFLGRVNIKFGIMDEDKNTFQEIMVLNLDGTRSTQQMPLSDIMYLTEHGTINIPPKKLLQRIKEKINREIEPILQEITNRVFADEWDEGDIRDYLILFNIQINNRLIPNAITEILSSDNVISGLLNQEEDQNYVFDLRKLKKFIKSEIFFTT